MKYLLIPTYATLISCSVIGGPPPHDSDTLPLRLGVCGGHIVLNQSHAPINSEDRLMENKADMNCKAQGKCLNLFVKLSDHSYESYCREKENAK